MKLDPVVQIPSAWSGVADRFGVHLFEGQLTISDMERMESIGDAWHQKHSGNLVELVIIFPSNTRMTSEERQRMAQLIKRWEKKREASATVILATGLIGAMQRSVLTGLLMLAPPPHPSKVFGAVADAVTWLAPYARSVCGAHATPDALLTAVTDLCEAFQKRS